MSGKNPNQSTSGVAPEVDEKAKAEQAAADKLKADQEAAEKKAAEDKAKADQEAADKAKAEQAAKPVEYSYKVLKPFRDAADFEKEHKAGSDVSKFSEDRLNHLVEIGYVSKDPK